MIRSLLILLAVGTMAALAVAQSNYPEQTIRILIGFAPGSNPDIAARIIGDKLSQAWGKPVVIESVTGAAGNMAVDRVARAAPDGHTLVLAGNGAMIINPSLIEKMPFDSIKDLAPISQVYFYANVVVVNKDLPVNTVQELIALARAQPGKLVYGSAGSGSTQHLTGELIKTMAKLDIQHVPYRGAAGLVPDLLGGRITMVFGSPTIVMPHVRGGTLKALAVTSLQRSSLLPDLPTMAESGFPGFDVTAWFGLMAPAKTSPVIIDKLHRETVRIMALPDVRERFAELANEIVANSPEQFSAIIKMELPKWAKLVQEAGIKRNE